MADPPEIVRLNVGGREYVTSVSTLRKVEGSMLAAMFGGKLPSATVNGSCFIDRDPELFAFVLEYLRDGKVEIPGSREALRRLEREANFFILPGLANLARSKLFEVCLEVKVYLEPYGCSEEKCKCGSNRLRYEAFSDSELEAMDDDRVLEHPTECRPCFKSPHTTTDVRIRAKLTPGNGDARLTIRPGLNSGVESAQLAAFVIFGKLRRGHCYGLYSAEGTFNEHTKYKNENGAVIYYSDRKWKVNRKDDTDTYMFYIDTTADTPPHGVWRSRDGETCIVGGEEDFPCPDELSIEEALCSIGRALSFGIGEGFGSVHLPGLLEPITDILCDFVRSPELLHRQLYLKTCAYYVGDGYDERRQRHHFKTCVKLEFEALTRGQCKRRRIAG